MKGLELYDQFETFNTPILILDKEIFEKEKFYLNFESFGLQKKNSFKDLVLHLNVNRFQRNITGGIYLLYGTFRPRAYIFVCPKG